MRNPIIDCRSSAKTVNQSQTLYRWAFAFFLIWQSAVVPIIFDLMVQMIGENLRSYLIYGYFGIFGFGFAFAIILLFDLTMKLDSFVAVVAVYFFVIIAAAMVFLPDPINKNFGWDTLSTYEPLARSDRSTLFLFVHSSVHVVLQLRYLEGFDEVGLMVGIQAFEVLYLVLLLIRASFLTLGSFVMSIFFPILLISTPLFLPHLIHPGYADLRLAMVWGLVLLVVGNEEEGIYGSPGGYALKVVTPFALAACFLAAKETGIYHFLLLVISAAPYILPRYFSLSRQSLLCFFAMLVVVAFGVFPYVAHSLQESGFESGTFFLPGLVRVSLGTAPVYETFAHLFAYDWHTVFLVSAFGSSVFGIVAASSPRVVYAGWVFLINAITIFAMCLYIPLFRSWAIEGTFLERMILSLAFPAAYVQVAVLAEILKRSRGIHE